MSGVPFGVIKSAIEKNDIIYFLGAGASLAGMMSKRKRTRALSSGELKMSLVDQLGDVPVSGRNDIDVSLAQAALHYERTAGRDVLLDTLKSSFAQTRTARNMPPCHDFIAATVGKTKNNPTIITTNYDYYMERSFQLRKIPFMSVSHVTNPDSDNYRKLLVEEWLPPSRWSREYYIDNDFYRYALAYKSPIIYKMHGTIHSDNTDIDADTVVLTEHDYLHFSSFILPEMPAYFIDGFKERHILFLGYSLADWNVKLLIYALNNGMSNRDSKNNLRRKKKAMWAISRNFHWVESIFWDRYEVRTFEDELERILPNLSSRLGV